MRQPNGRDLAIEALRFDESSTRALKALESEREDWIEILRFCDGFHLTLPLARRLNADACPGLVQTRLAWNLRANRVRMSAFAEAYAAIRERWDAEHLVLKGFTLAPEFCPDAAARVQYDLDLYSRRDAIEPARSALTALGYEPVASFSRFPADHLPPMTQKTGWQWRGDFFDTSIPPTVELHFRFWDRGTERFGPAGLDDLFWERRRVREWNGVPFTCLSEADSLGYACLHALRHLLRGDARPSHFLEIGYFLERQRDPVFWDSWRKDHPEDLRQIESICFRFAQEWFGCRLPEGAAALLPDPVNEWFRHFGRSPLEAQLHPQRHRNKDELWLHLSLIEGFWNQAAVVRRRLLPVKPPGPVDAVHLPADQLTLRRRALKHARWLRFASARAWHHATALLPSLGSGVRWSMIRSGFSADFGRFFLAFLAYNAAMLVFHLLYNLHLTGLGLREDVIGRIAGMMTMGSLAGTLLIGAGAARVDLRRALIFCFVAQGIVSIVRVAAVEPLVLIGAAFVSGCTHALFAVLLSPAVAALTSEKARPFAFSLTFSCGISLGIGVGLVGGVLPSMLQSTANVLFAACGLAVLAALPLIGFRGFGRHQEEAGGGPVEAMRLFVPDRSLGQFLAALGLWHFATGAFNPFFNVYLARAMRFPVETVGVLFTTSQIAQVVAMQFSPMLLRWLGLVRGIAATQALAGLALVGLGVAGQPMLAALLFPLFMALQYMTEPGIFTRLMQGLPSGSARAGASAWNFAIVFTTHSLAAWMAGEAIARFGYSPVWSAAGILVLLAAWAMTRVTSER